MTNQTSISSILEAVMLDDLVLLHTHNNLNSIEWPQLGLKVKTCMRAYVLINRQELKNFDSQWEVYKGQKAYSYLVEILCGLHSRVFGETEVFGQFKKAWMEQQSQIQCVNLKKIIHWVLEDVKKLRNQYITAICLNSYGSVVRKVLTTDSVDRFGSGQLAASIVPWLKEQDLSVYGSFQNKEITKFCDVKSYDQYTQTEPKASLIIATDMSDKKIGDLLDNKSSYQLILDLREQSNNENASILSLTNEYIPLKGFFDYFQGAESKKKKTKEKIFVAMKSLVQSRYYQQIIRPFGWDDLCS